MDLFKNEMCPLDNPQELDIFVLWLSCCFLIMFYFMVVKMILRLSKSSNNTDPLLQEMNTFLSEISRHKNIKDQFFQANILANQFKMNVYQKLLRC
jgi:hypothetical protein